MNVIVLDTNILVADFRFSGAAARSLLDGRRRGAIRLAVPEVVVEETVAKYREMFNSVLEAEARVNRRLRQLLGPKAPFRQLPLGVDAAEDYETFLRGLLRAEEATILPCPTVPHRTLVQRALSRKRPFAKGDAGYRDVLIWLSTVDLASTSDGESVAFVSTNSKDFADGDSLHPDLAEDLKTSGLAGDAVVLFSSVRDVNSRLVDPILERADTALKGLNEGTFPGWSRESWVEEEIRALVEDDILEDLFSFPAGTGTASLSKVLEFDLAFSEAFLLTNGDIVASYSLSARFDFAVDVDWGEWEQSDAVRQYVGDIDDHFLWATFSEFAHVGMDGTVVISHENPTTVVPELSQVWLSGG